MSPDATPVDLASLLEALAAQAGGVTSAGTAAGTTEYRRGKATFAALRGQAVELRLDPEVAEAAARTPDTRLSERGSGWVRFAPPALDAHAEDRLRAWFLSAWRAAARD